MFAGGSIPDFHLLQIGREPATFTAPSEFAEEWFGGEFDGANRSPVARVEEDKLPSMSKAAKPDVGDRLNP